MARTTVEKRVTDLESALMQMVYQSRQTDIRFAAFVDEMAVFKNEMKVFKDEMTDFKNEMKVFKDEMTDFKNEMKVFKDEMATFKNETKVYMERLDNITADMNRKWGELANKMGTIAEDIVAPGFPFLIEKTFNFSVEDIGVRRRIKDQEGNSWEFDVVARAGEYLFIIDVKSSYNKIEYIHYFYEVLLPKAKELLPEFKIREYRLVGCIASFRLDDSIIHKASEMGILAISLGGNYLNFLNFEEVRRNL